MGVLVMIGQFLLGITILVGIHEAGHMLIAKFFGMRVEKFSIGFPPVLAWFEKGETKYQVGLLPLGGFVKISGMIDESMDKNQLAESPKPWEFRSKPAWQRLLVMLGGIIFNVILGCIIFSTLTYKYGEEYLPIEKAEYGVYVGELAEKIGLQTGDKIIMVNGKTISKFNEVVSTDVLLNEGSYYTVSRNGKELDVTVPDTLINALSDEGAFFLNFDFEFLIGENDQGGVGYEAGLKEGDKILTINDEPVKLFSWLKKTLSLHKGEKVLVNVLRGQDTLSYKIDVSENGLLGVSVKNLMIDKFETEYFSLPESILKGSQNAFAVVVVNLKGISKIFKGDVDATKATMGVTGMAKMYGDEMKGRKFWTICGLLSMALALFNLFPVPGLDGGHVMFLTYEMITGKKASQKVQEVALKVGFALLISLMLFVNIAENIR